jgi:2-amino-4-hydroxy-6-hydroxymethyldihydropteridine diphosphokinase
MRTKNSNKVETIYLLLGSNQGDRLKNLNQAKIFIDELTRITVKSSIYLTKAWGNINQDDFLNEAVEIKSGIAPEVLLEHLKEIEIRTGRIAGEKWGPRIIDIDILFYGNKIIQTENLTVPHPKMEARRFALTPLAEIAPGVVHPVLRLSVGELLERCTDTLDVEKYGALD